MLGLETALSIVRETMVDPGCSTGPRSPSGCPSPGADRPGGRARSPVAVGEPANIVLYDPSVRRVVDSAEVASLSRNTPYAGMELPGRVVATFLRGTPTVIDARKLATAGSLASSRSAGTPA